MSAPLACTVMSSPSRNSGRINAYVHNPKHGQAKGDRYVMASGLNGAIPEYAEHQMRQNRKRWGKNAMRQVKVPWAIDQKTGEKKYRSVSEGEYVQAYHVIISHAREGRGALDPNVPSDQAEAHRIGRELARELAGTARFATVHTQIDGKTGCLHSHIVIDSIEKATGRSFDSSAVKHSVLVRTTNDMLLALGYEQVNEYHHTALERREKSEERGLLKHVAWEADGQGTEVEPFSVAVLKQRLKAALADTSYTDLDGFREVCLANGLDVEQRGAKGRGLVYQMRRRDVDGEYIEASNSDRRRASTLGRFAMMDAVEQAMERNVELAREQQQTAKPARSMTMAEMIAAMADVDAELAEQRAYSAAALLESWASERRTREMLAEALRAEVEVSDETVEETTIDPRMALAEQVCLDTSELRRWNLRSPDRYEMWQRGMSDQDVEDAISAWYDLDQPKTTWEREREAQHGAPATAGTAPGSAPATAGSSPETGPPLADPVVEEQVAVTATKETAEPETTVTVETPQVVEEAAEPQAEEAVEDEGHHGAPATASSTPDPAPATAGTGPEVSSTSGEWTPTPYRSRVRNRKPTREREEPAWEQMVAIDERWQALLADGGAVDGGLAKGLRVGTLQRYEEDLDPAVAYELWRRAAKLAEAKRAREVQQNEELAAAMRAEVDAGDLAWSGEPGTLEELKMAATRGLTSREKALKQFNEPVLETRHEDGELER